MFKNELALVDWVSAPVLVWFLSIVHLVSHFSVFRSHKRKKKVCCSFCPQHSDSWRMTIVKSLFYLFHFCLIYHDSAASERAVWLKESISSIEQIQPKILHF